MKLNTKNNKRSKGMTLLELTVVILVLLSLISVLFFGATAYIKGSERTNCIMNIRKIQLAARGYQNLNNLKIGDALVSTTFTGSGNFLEEMPSCPSSSATVPVVYTPGTTVPALGSLYATCAKSLTADDHLPGDYASW